MNKKFEELKKEKIVAISRGVSPDNIVAVVDKIYKAGIRFLEIAFPSPEDEDVAATVKSIKLVKENFPALHVGAGTVVNLDLVETAYKIGAEFTLSPNFRPEVVSRTVELGMMSFPGVFSPSEMIDAYNLGATSVKLFPVEVLGEGYIKALGDPIGYVPIMGVGGINLDNMKRYYDVGVSSFGIGNSLISGELVKAGRLDEIYSRAKKFVEIAKQLDN